MLGAAGSPLAAEKLKVAVLTPGLTNDGSFNQAAADAVRKLAAEGLITVEVREKLADPAASEPVIRQYAAKGYDLIIGHGIELSEPILKVAAEFPKTHFAASGGTRPRGKVGRERRRLDL
jgi:basic membrane protein A and related proteins